MPILHVKALPQKDPNKIKQALRKTCLAISEFYKCEPSNVWATWEEIKPGWYVEGELDAEIQPDGTHPPIATLTCFEGLSEETIEELLILTSKTLSEELNLADIIFITFHEAKSGQVIAGNGIVRKN